MATPTVTTPQPNQALGQFVQVLNGLQTVSVAVTGTTRATFSVSDFTVTLTGTNLAASGGQLTGGTITSIKFVEASPATTLVLSGLALSVASVNAAVAAEQAGDSFALDRLLGNLD